MTERLYYKDPALLEFKARIVETGRDEDRYYTVLDRSAFYPTSGGQLFDTGTLNGAAIIDVVETPEGDVRHLSTEPVGNVGDEVTGIVDAHRRKTHRQQHTAQHILSQVFVKLFDLETVSVHLGEEYGAIEFDTDSITDEQRQAAEEMANEIIFANHPVDILFAEPDEVPSIPLRRPPKKEGTLRVIRIGDFEYSACGGTHCERTGQVGIIKLIGTGKMRGHALVNFLAGEQARADYAARFAVTSHLAQHFSCHLNDLTDKVTQLETSSRELRFETTRLQKELMPLQVQALVARATPVGERQLVVSELSNYDPKLALQFAAMIADRIHGLAAILLDGRLIVAVDARSGLHAGNIVKAFTAETGLRGGGGPVQAQVGGADPAQLQNYRTILENLLRAV